MTKKSDSIDFGSWTKEDMSALFERLLREMDDYTIRDLLELNGIFEDE